ncbi:MAG: hypothetical protein HY738_07785 [Bacteroidia bacterium]|nr:hypothetical protein [Bacteroidia bacterium]
MKFSIIKYLFLISALLASFRLSSQNIEDVIYLKNGSIIHGKIIEKTEEKIKIESHDRNIWAFPVNEIDSVKSDKVYTPITIPAQQEELKKIIIKEQGFINRTDIGFLINSSALSFSTFVINGYKFKYGFSASGGTGFEIIDEHIHFPLFADIHYFPFNRRHSPYIYTQGGYLSHFENLSPNYIKDGILLNVGLGIAIFSSENEAFTVSIGYSFEKEYRERYIDWRNSNKYKYEVIFHRIAFRLGYFFR